MKLSKILALPLLVGAILTPTTEAAVVSGVLNTTGAVRVTSTTLDFFPAGGTSGLFLVDLFTQTGDFVPLAGTTGTITDLTGHTAGVPFAPELFLTFTANPTLQFYLTLIEEGVFGGAQCFAAPAAGQNCTPAAPGDFLNLSNLTSDSSVASFTVRGFVTDGSGDPASNFTGTFSTQFTTNSFQELLTTVGGGGSVQATYSANFVVEPAAVPEPSTVSMMLLGTVGVVIGAIRRRARQ